jgi:N-acetylglucosaminyl-diphospho-decaprenol L-rhamnosyltransferase
METKDRYKNDLSIIIVAFNVKDLVQKCLSCVKDSQDSLKKEIIYVENGSTDDTEKMVRRHFPEVKIITTPVNLGFVKANNLGYASASGKYVLMLNSDAFVKENTLQMLTDFMEKHPDCGIVGCNAINREGSMLPSARFFPTPWRLFLTKMGWAGKFPLWKDINDNRKHNLVRECDWVTGCCLLVRKEITDTFGFFLRPELFMYNDDNDLCLRVKKKGWKIYCLPETITHLTGANNTKIMRERKDTHGITRLYLESDYVYFRHNYSIFMVLQHFALMSSYEILQILKNIVLMRGTDKIKESYIYLKIIYQMLIETHFGRDPIERRNKS